MAHDSLNIYHRPSLRNPQLLLGFSGWMDGGEVSTGSVKYLIEKLEATKFAEIMPAGFYIYNFPGMMEVTALFRPHTRIEDGLIKAFEFPSNIFFADESNNLILFLGKEPNLQWEAYADCVLALCETFDVQRMHFIGSVSGLVPHTREPRLFCSASNAKLKETLQHYGVNFSNYEGPASLITYLTTRCAECDIDMVSLVATVPAYVQGNNPRCIEAVTRRLAGILGLEIESDDLRAISDEFEKRLSDVVQEQPELAENIHKLEEDYDNEIFDNEMGDLKTWLQQQGIRLD
ncbi:MAG: PAC2 family protein [Phycisphaerales bacterium]|nr:MAG: PAC2 family protein [Phycisphaerales bacterium]